MKSIKQYFLLFIILLFFMLAASVLFTVFFKPFINSIYEDKLHQKADEFIVLLNKIPGEKWAQRLDQWQADQNLIAWIIPEQTENIADTATKKFNNFATLTGMTELEISGKNLKVHIEYLGDTPLSLESHEEELAIQLETVSVYFWRNILEKYQESYHAFIQVFPDDQVLDFGVESGLLFSSDISSMMEIQKIFSDGEFSLKIISLENRSEYTVSVFHVIFIWLICLPVLWFILHVFDKPVVDTQQRINRAIGQDKSLEIDQSVELLLEELIRLRKKENTRQEQWRDLLYAVAHELRSPLTRINFALELMPDSTPEEMKDLRHDVDQAIDEANHMVKEVLSYSRLESQDQLTEFEWIDIDTLVQALTTKLVTVYPESTFDCQGEHFTVMGDEKLLGRAIINIMRNAARYSQNLVSVSWEKNAESTTWMLTVEDDGPGIPPGKRARIFEPFTRLDPTRSRDSGGVGLGLAIVKSVVNLHRGEILVEDSESGGSRFVMKFPLQIS